MNGLEVLDLGRDTLWVILKMSLPIMLIGLTIGVVVGLLQALTQIQEMTLTFIPKIIGIFLGLLIFTPFMSNTLTTFTHVVFDRAWHGPR
jgi:flagellar biosynthetic protein FliQ